MRHFVYTGYLGGTVLSEIFYCKNCGGIMEFDAATQSLKCPHCGEEQKIDANRSAVREHKLTAEARQMVRVQDKKSTTMSILRSNGGSGT